MSMIGTHGDGYLSLLLQFKESPHYVIHVYVAFKMIGFVEIAFGIALSAAEVNEVNTVTKPVHHAFEVVGTAYTQANRCRGKAH